MEAVIVALAHNIEEERICVVVEGLVVQKKLGQQTQVLSIGFVFSPVDFEKGNVVFPVDFIARWVPEIALGYVSLQAVSTLYKLQAELTEVNAGQCNEFLWIR